VGEDNPGLAAVGTRAGTSVEDRARALGDGGAGHDLVNVADDPPGWVTAHQPGDIASNDAVGFNGEPRSVI
jgi:hypothetical protein